MATVAAVGKVALGALAKKKVAETVIGGVGSYLQGRAARKAAEGAAQTQQQYLGQGIQGLSRAFRQSQQQFQPFVGAERQALEQRSALLGLSGPQAQQAALQSIQQSPETQFLQQEAEQGVLRNAAAIGGLGGGRVRQELARQAQGLATQNIQRRLQNLQGFGMGATAGLAGLREAKAGSVANLQTGQGEALASGILGSALAKNQMIGQIARTSGRLIGRG